MRNLHNMLSVLIIIAGVISGSYTIILKEEACYGRDFTFPDSIYLNLYNGTLYFAQSDGGQRKTLMQDGKVMDQRLRANKHNLRLTNLNKKDEGFYRLSYNLKVLQLNIQDCAEKITVYYDGTWEYRISRQIQYVEYTPLDNEDATLILWNLTDPQSNNQRGHFKNNYWTISKVNQEDNGYYNFRQKDGTLVSRVLFTVLEDAGIDTVDVNDQLRMESSFSGRPWTVTFKPRLENEQVTVIKDGQVVRDGNMFHGRITILSYGIEINPIKSTDSGVFEFRDQRGNLAKSVQVHVIQESHHAITYVVVAVVALLLGICCCYCCCCKKRCCKKDKPAAAAATTEGSAVNFHDKSAAAAPGPAVYYHGTNHPTGPSNPNQSYPSHYPPHPVHFPAFTGPAAVSVEPMPNSTTQFTTVYPPKPASVYPPQPASVYPPQPASVYPPQPTNVNAPQPEPSLYPLSEIGPLTSQESTAAPTFSSYIISSDAETRFQLKGTGFPSAPPLSSDAHTSDVYTSDKLNFL